MCGTALKLPGKLASNVNRQLSEIHMYIGGGLLGLVLIIFLVVWLARRA
jgi:hypothetical protein